jgi:hypothetical protein
LATTGSVGRKVPSVALRLNCARPNWKSIAGEQVPKSLDETEAVVFEAAGAWEAEEEAVDAAVVFAAAAAAGMHDAVAVAARRRARRMLGVCILAFYLVGYS